VKCQCMEPSENPNAQETHLSNKTQPNQVLFRISCSIGKNLAVASVECRPMEKAALTASPCMVHVWTDLFVPCRYWLVSKRYWTNHELAGGTSSPQPQTIHGPYQFLVSCP